MTAVPINPIRPIRRPPCFLLKAMNIKKNNFAQEDDGVSGEFTVELSSARVRLIVNEGYCIQFNKGGTGKLYYVCLVILGLDAVLIYYPRHLSAAVAFTEGQPGGDFVVYDGRRYTVCDATCQYGPIGYSGKFDNSQAILIPLSR